MTERPMRQWQDRAVQIYGVGSTKGDLAPAHFAAALCSIHAAISRAYEMVLAECMELIWLDGAGKVLNAWHLEGVTDFSGLRPSGLPVALAEVFLRSCALADAYGAQLGPLPIAGARDARVMEGLSRLHSMVADCGELEHATSEAEGFDTVVDDVMIVACGIGIDLLAAAEILYAYEMRARSL